MGSLKCVKSFKTHLKKIAKSFTYEEFSTNLARIEVCLNSRPLSSITDIPSVVNHLSSGHFLIGSAILSPLEPDFSNEPLSYANRWRKLKMHYLFARYLKDEYLIRYKWKIPQRDFVVDDFVVIRHDHLPPNEWKLGRIERFYVGPDSKVRVADICTANGVLTRPIVKLVLFPNYEQN